MPRTRSFSSAPHPAGYYKQWTTSGINRPFPDPNPFSGPVYDSDIQDSGTFTCVDTVMSPPFNVDHDLTITKKRTLPTRLYGRRNLFPTISSHTEYYGSIVAFKDVRSCPTVTEPTFALLKTKALKQMNPSRSKVSVPLFLFELREVPRMLESLWKTLSTPPKSRRPSEVSDAWLSVNFGWAPLVKDVVAMFNVAADIEERKRYLLNLEKGTAVRGSLGSKTEVTSDGTVVYNTGWLVGRPAVIAELHTTLSWKRWFTANAVLTGSLPDTNLGLEELSASLVTGMRFDPVAVYNAIPWSWLVDYFWNVGTFLEASEGIIPWKCTRLNIMSTVTARQSYSNMTRDRYSAMTMNPNGYAETVVKYRRVYANPTPSLGFTQLLSDTAQANLGALAISKALGRGSSRGRALE